MAKIRKGKLAGPDDPIFKEGVTFYTRPSDRASTSSPTLSKAVTVGKATFHGLNKSPDHLPRIGSQVIFNPKRKPPAKPKED